MAQADGVVSNASGAAVRADLNNQLAAVFTNHSGATEPTTTYAYQWWADTTTGLLKIRNAANSAWVTVGTMADVNLGLLAASGGTLTGALLAAAGSETLPSIAFSGDTNTGVWSPGSDQIAISTGGTGRLFVDSSGNVGLGSSSPSTLLHLSSATGSASPTPTELRIATTTSASDWSTTDPWGRISFYSADVSGTGPKIHAAIDAVALDAFQGTSSLQFRTSLSDGTLPVRMTIDNSGNVGVGTTSPDLRITVQEDNPGRCISFLSNDGNAGGRIGTTGEATTSNGLLLNANRGSGSIQFQTNSLERARIDSSGRLLVGTSSARSTFNTDQTLQVQLEGTDYPTSSAGIVRNSSNSGSPCFALAKSRGTAAGSHTIVVVNDDLGRISFEGADGSKLISAARITAAVDGTPGTDDMPGRLEFSTTADGANSPTERMRIASGGEILAQGVYDLTTATAANVNVASNGTLRRSTSSAKYKTDIETVENSYSDALLQCRPVWYRSTSQGDNPDWGFWGFIAEEVAAIDPRLVHWKTVEITYDENGSVVQTPCDPEPEGVAYDRFVPHLLNLIKRQGEAIANLQAEVAVLKAQ